MENMGEVWHQDELADTPSVAIQLEIELALLQCKL
jgi:hypothetical protein